MLPVELFDWEGLEAPLVLDLAASPGGKTTHLVAKTGDRGLVLANDSSADRITALRLVLQNWGGLHTAVTNFHGEKFGGWFPDTFDRVLLDAPVQHAGPAFERSPPHARDQRARAQRVGPAPAAPAGERLAGASARAGRWCIRPARSNPRKTKACWMGCCAPTPARCRWMTWRPRLPMPAPGLAAANGATYAAVQHSARLWPHLYHTAGFFAARLTKLAPSGGEIAALPGPPAGAGRLAAAGAQGARRNMRILPGSLWGGPGDAGRAPRTGVVAAQREGVAFPESFPGAFWRSAGAGAGAAVG